MINKISFSNGAYIHCKSNFYSCVDVLQSYMKFEFSKGVNKLVGEIDSGIFAISYLLSMYRIDVPKSVFDSIPMITVDDSCMELEKFTPVCCYLDQSYPLFSSSKTVRNQVSKGLKKSGLNYTPDEICDMFKMEKFRFDRPIVATGNEKYKAMAAIGFSHGKEVFCFPWLSRMRYEAFHNHMPHLLDTLEGLGKIVILPVGE